MAGKQVRSCGDSAIELTKQVRDNLAASGDVAEGPREAAHHVPGADDATAEPVTSTQVAPAGADSPVAGSGVGLAGSPQGSEAGPSEVEPARIVDGVMGVDRTHDPDFADVDEPVPAGHGRALPGDRSADTNVG